MNALTVIDSAKRFFKPKSPLQQGQTQDMSSPAAAADQRLDLTLQNLLSIGVEFTPDDIINLRRRARYGDARWLYSLYDEMMRLGPASQVLKAREALKGTQTLWHATPNEADEDENSKDPNDKLARLIRDVTEEAWSKFLPDLKNHLSTKYFYGISGLQVMWRPRAIENKWSRVTDIRPIPARRFRLDPETLRFKFLANPFSWDGPFVDDLQKTGKLIFTEVGADTEPLDQRGLLFQCLILWAMEQFTVRWRAKRLQNFGMPPVMVEYPNADPSTYAAAIKLADQLAAGTRAAVPKGMIPSLLTGAGGASRGADPYDSAIEWIARCYDQIILGHGQVSGVQVGAGSRSSSGDAISLFKDVTNSRAKELDVDLQQQAWFPYVAREFGTDKAELYCPVTESSVIERDDPIELSTVLVNVVNAGAGGSIPIEEMLPRCGIDVAEDGQMTFDGTVKGAPKPAPTAVPGQPGVAAAGQGGKQMPPLKAPGKAQDPDGEAASGGANFAGMGDMQAPAASVLRMTRRGTGKRKRTMEFYSRRQRFSAAALVGGRPRVTITSFGHEHNEPISDMNFDVRTMGEGKFDAMRTGRDHDVKRAIEKHPMTEAVVSHVKAQILRAIDSGKTIGQADMHFGIGCEHGRHRSVYVAERLGKELRFAGHDVTVVHRDATLGKQKFYSADQQREDNGRFAPGRAETASTKDSHAQAAAYHQGRATSLTMKAFKLPPASTLEPGDADAQHVMAKAVAGHARAASLHEQATHDPAFSKSAREATVYAHAVEKPAMRFAVDEELFYSDDEQRDDHGRWSGGSQDPGTMRGHEITQELTRIGKANSKAVDAMIAAGRGHERPSETSTKTDPLSKHVNSLSDRHALLIEEIAQRAGPGWTSLPRGVGASPRIKASAESFYSEDQPRNPAGSSDGGEWAGSGGREAGAKTANAMYDALISHVNAKDQIGPDKGEYPGTGDYDKYILTGQGGIEPAHEGKDMNEILLDKLNAEGGFTVQPMSKEGLNEKPDGYAVSIHPEAEKILDAKTVNAGDINQFLNKNVNLLQDEKNFVGAWLDTESGKVFLDVSTVVKSESEAHDLGIKYNQKAYYDLRKGKTVTIPEVHRVVHSAVQEAIRSFAVRTGRNRGRDRLDDPEDIRGEEFAEAGSVAAKDFRRTRPKGVLEAEARMATRMRIYLDEQKRAAVGSVKK